MDPTPADGAPTEVTDAVQRRIEEVLLGGKRKYTRAEVAELSGVPPERTHRLWRALGFATVGDDDVVFTDADVEAVRLGDYLMESGLVDRAMDASVTRALGHHLSRLAEWQVHMVRDWLAQRPEIARDEEQTGKLIELALPTLERLQNYVWRRHLAAFAGRALAVSEDELESRAQVVGFVDMVGYTRMTRRVDETELSAVLENFEAIAGDVIAERHGRIVKMIGDEVLFVADNPLDAVEIALSLNEHAEHDERLPELRTGLASGHVLNRLGDVYGSVVNIAARLTSVARPGTILIDQVLAAEIEGNKAYDVRSLRPQAVRGYHKLRPHALRRRDDSNGNRDRDNEFRA